jgi:hypothetical protein
VRAFARAIAKFALGALCIAFFVVVWSGLQVSLAIGSGALDQATGCYDGGHLRREVEGKLRQRDVDWALSRQVWDHVSGKPGPGLYGVIRRASIQLGWSTFWSAEQRRSYYRTLSGKMRPCSSALRQLKRQGRLTPEIQAFSEMRFRMLGLPMPSMEEPTSRTNTAQH